MPFAVRYVSKNYQIEIRTIQYISCLEQPPTPTAKDNQLSATHYLLDPSLIRADGDLVEEVEMDPHIAERRRWIVGIERKIIREHWFSYRLEREAEATGRFTQS
jgi:hypothetical protein